MASDSGEVPNRSLMIGSDGYAAAEAKTNTNAYFT
jgi:hypothetical protein